MLKNRVIYLLVLLGLLLFYLYCSSYVPFAAICLLLGFTAVGAVCACIASRSVEVTVKTSPADLEKREVEFCVCVENKSAIPAPVVLFDVFFRDAAESGVIRRRIRVSAASFEKKEVFLPLSAPYAAYVEAEAKRIRVCDAFGVISFPAKKRSSSSGILITPAYTGDAREYRICSSVVADTDRYSDVRRGDDRSQVFEVREYRDGDDVRNVHWRLSSKLDSLMVKEFSFPIEERCAVLLETSLAPDGSIHQVKERADRVLGTFVFLASSLLEAEQLFDVRFYSPSGRQMLSFPVAEYGDIAAALKAFLSEKLSEEPLYTFHTFISESSGEAAYYLFDSSVPGSDPPSSREELVVIDCAPAETTV